MSHEQYSFAKYWQQMKNFQMNIAVKKKFSDQVDQVDDILANDKTGIVSTIYDFMVHSATVPMKIETKNETLDTLLLEWQKKMLNADVNLDIPSGLRALSVENYKERWRSSLLGLNVIWSKVKIENQGTWVIPTQMWFVDGGAVVTESDGKINTRKYFLNTNNKKKDYIPLKNTDDESVFIRRPYTPWHQDKVIPYFTQRGTIYNALMKNGITKKQAEVIEVIIPILLEMKAGNDRLAEQGMAPTKEQFEELKNQFIEAKENFDTTGKFGDIIAALRHDVNLNYLIPDLTKIFDEKIVRSTDKNLLSSLGMIELQGFSSTRTEAILNPKVLIEEVTDAVLDWSDLLEAVMYEMLDRNKEDHPTLANSIIRVIPGKIKAFITDDMRAMLRSLYDRGVISKQTGVEDIAGLDFEVQVERREKEDERDLQTVMKPPIIQNLEQYDEPQNLEDQDKLPGTPEADNFNNAIMKNYSSFRKLRKKKLVSKNFSKDHIINVPEELPKKIKELDDAKQLIYFLNYNFAIEDGKPVEEAIKMAEEAIKFQELTVAKKVKVIAPFEKIDDLPDNVKSVLPPTAQMLWLKVFNSVLEQTGDETKAAKAAWAAVSEKYEKVDDKKKWVKKACLEDYEEKMSKYAYGLFVDIYNNTLDKSNSNNQALEMALSTIEKVCVKNKNGIYVKDKTISKSQIQALENNEIKEQILNLELKEKKSALLDKLLEDN